MAIHVLCAGLDKVLSESDIYALEKHLPFLTGARFSIFGIARTILRCALINKTWYDFIYIIADNLYEAQDSFVEAMDLINYCRELRFLVYRDGVFKLASGNRVYRIPPAAIVRFSGATSLTQAARLMDLVASELSFILDLPIPTVDFGDLFKTDAIVSGSRSIQCQGMTAEYHYRDTQRQALLEFSSSVNRRTLYRLNLYAEQLMDDEWSAGFYFDNYSSSLPALVSCIFWDWLVENALKAFVRLDDETTARITAGFPVEYTPLID